MRPETGVALRLLGPAIEVACLVLLFALPGARLPVVGLPLAYLLYAGLALGLALVIIGLTMASHPRQD
jgi:hypothetical protein